MTLLQEKLARRAGETGSGRIGAIIALVVIVALIYFLVMYVPVRINNAQLEQEAKELSTSFAVGNIKTEDRLIEEIVDAAREIEIPVTAQNVEIQDGSKVVRARIRYKVPIAYVWGEKLHEFDIDVEVPKL